MPAGCNWVATTGHSLVVPYTAKGNAHTMQQLHFEVYDPESGKQGLSAVLVADVHAALFRGPKAEATQQVTAKHSTAHRWRGPRPQTGRGF